jgi:hypothetical protein
MFHSRKDLLKALDSNNGLKLQTTSKKKSKKKQVIVDDDELDDPQSTFDSIINKFNEKTNTKYKKKTKDATESLIQYFKTFFPEENENEYSIFS